MTHPCQQFSQGFGSGVELTFQNSDSPGIGVLFGPSSIGLEGPSAIFEELLLSLVEEGRLDASLFANGREGRLLEEVLAQDGYLLVGGEMFLRFGHGVLGYLNGEHSNSS